MKQIFIIFISVLLTSISFGSPDTTYMNCFLHPVRAVGFDKTANFKTDILSSYLIEHLPKGYFDSFNGELSMQILISTQGRPCLKYLSGYHLDPEPLRQVIREMPDWEPAMDGNELVNASTIIMMNFEQGKIVHAKHLESRNIVKFGWSKISKLIIIMVVIGITFIIWMMSKNKN